MNKKVLIVTNHSDIHADLVVEKMRARGHSPFRLNLDEFPAQFAHDAEFRDGTWKSTFASAPRTARPRARVAWALRQLETSASRVPVHLLVARAGVARKHFAELFARVVSRVGGALGLLRPVASDPRLPDVLRRCAGRCGASQRA